MKLPVFRDPKNNSPSVTMTAFAIGFVIASLKLLVSGMELDGIKMGSFDGSDFAMVMAALGGVYTLRRHSDSVTGSERKQNEKKE